MSHAIGERCLVPAFTTFSHVSLCVTNLEKARAFYGGVLGWQELPRPNFGFPGAWYRVTDDVQCHLIVAPATSPPAERGERFAVTDPHFALWTDDADETARELARQGISFDELPASPTGLRQLFIKDPDANMIEFIGPAGKATAGGAG